MYFDGERRSVLAHVGYRRSECVAVPNRLNPPDILSITIGMHESGWVQANEILAGIAMQCAGRGIGLNYQIGFDIVEDQPIANSFKDAPIRPFFRFTLQLILLAVGRRHYSRSLRVISQTLLPKAGSCSLAAKTVPVSELPFCGSGRTNMHRNHM